MIYFFLAIFLHFLAYLAPKNHAAPLIPPKIATPSAILDMPPVIPPTPKVPWGTTEKIEDHIYRTFVGNDPKMGTPEEILTALNAYRKNHGAGELGSDQKLCDLAQKRAGTQAKNAALDKHRGLIEYMDNPDHWKELDITSIGENASQGYILSGVHLIEWVFDADSEHRDNQLNPQWTHGCAGISESTVDIIFGKK